MAVPTRLPWKHGSSRSDGAAARPPRADPCRFSNDRSDIMTTIQPFLSSTTAGERLELVAAGAWTAAHADAIEQQTKGAAQQATSARSIALDVGGLERLDTFGAW